MLYPIHALNLNILQVKGRSDLFLSLEILKISIGSILIFIAIWMEIGIVGLVAVVIMNSYISLFINTYFSGREISYSVKEQLKDLVPVYLITLTMGAAVYVAGMILPESNFLRMTLQIALGISFYIIACRVFKIKELKIIVELIFPLIKKMRFAKVD